MAEKELFELKVGNCQKRRIDESRKGSLTGCWCGCYCIEPFFLTIGNNVSERYAAIFFSVRSGFRFVESELEMTELRCISPIFYRF